MSSCNMSKYYSNGWYSDETIALFGIIKQLQLHTKSEVTELDWHHVAHKLEKKGHTRTIADARDRFNQLRYDYFSARWKSKTCEYYNYLNELLHDQKTPVDCISASPEPTEAASDDVALARVLSHDSASGKKLYRSRWPDAEVQVFLNIVINSKLEPSLLRDGNEEVYKMLSKEMLKRACKKSPEQLLTQFDRLVMEYEKAQNGGDNMFEHFYAMHEILNVSKKVATDNQNNQSGESDCNESENEDKMSVDSEDSADSSKEASKRVRWTEEEVKECFSIITSMGLERKLLRKRNAKIFRVISREMSKRGIRRTAHNIRVKFQIMRSLYNKAKRSGGTFEHYESMHKILNPPDVDDGNEENSVYSEDEDDEETDKNKGIESRYWSDAEVDAMLGIIKQQNLYRALDGSRKRNFKTLLHISNLMAKQAMKKTPYQVKNKLRVLLLRYRESKRDGVNVTRILQRHFDILDDMLEKKTKTKSVKSTSPKREKEAHIAPKPQVQPKPTKSTKSMSSESEDDSPFQPEVRIKCESESSSSTCDLLQSVAKSENFNDEFELPLEPSPLEVMSTISENQKQLLEQLKKSNLEFFRELREMQRQFCADMTSMLRQDRQETFKMLKELLQSKQ